MSQLPEREIGNQVVGAMHRSTGSFELVVAALAAAGLGFWIDYVLGVVPLFTLIFALIGFVGAGYSIYLTYTDQMVTANTERDVRRGAPAAGVTGAGVTSESSAQ